LVIEFGEQSLVRLKNFRHKFDTALFDRQSGVLPSSQGKLIAVLLARLQDSVDRPVQR
jgi:hypothetical protein